MEGKTLVTQFRKEYAAQLAKDKLEQAGITATILDHPDSISRTDGLYEIYVAENDSEKAKEIIAEINE